ncbi:GntR family transcriptional regulator [Chitinophaga lutea]|uniref:GntR family transcriptional regulator n=1 Tax=Chitinophaga lutea TaxID=2488634 RepID=A0A3N4QDR5_9BACT|nr:substrate-binding domain-containing protein [Chitinophaga lutea]RPE14097.1 GntR family transcriptional regulator [Chitinophaga lutea]
MKPSNIFRYLNIDDFSATPKYQQLANAIIKAVGEAKIQRDEILPSINEMSYELDISRDTAEKAFKYLKSRGVLGSVPGKGYYVMNASSGQPYKILLLFNKLSEHKKIIYDSFAAKLGTQASIDFYIYNSDFGLFKKLLSRNLQEYTHVVILPHFRERQQHLEELVNGIPREKLILLDKKLKGIAGEYSAVYENFREDIYHALEQAREKLQKYRSLHLIFPENTYYPEEIREGFLQFCEDYAFPHSLVPDIAEESISAGSVYINLREHDLVALIEKIRSLHLNIGKDVGIISYNETPLKKFILNGLTTISTDFAMMGELAAGLITDNAIAQIEVPFNVTLRESL